MLKVLQSTIRGYATAGHHGPAIVTPEIEKDLDLLREGVEEHSFWNNQLFLACDEGQLTREDFAVFFGEYYAYTSKFTRYLSAVMVNCHNDYYRAMLSENMWEEGGMLEPEERHAQLFRNFLSTSLGIDEPALIETKVFSKYFSETFLQDIIDSHDSAYSASYLSLGTEGIVPAMYTRLRDGMLKAGFDESELYFFDLHIACDDGHAETLEEMMLDDAFENPGWFDTCAKARDRALNLREEFFNECFEYIGYKKLQDLFSTSVEHTGEMSDDTKVLNTQDDLVHVYSNKKGEVDFNVSRTDLDFTVLDPRIVKVPVGSENEYHTHAHEACFLIVQGEGDARVGDKRVAVKKGDICYVPRWERHQVINTGDEEIIYFAVTDYNFIKNFVGYNDLSYREK